MLGWHRNCPCAGIWLHIAESALKLAQRSQRCGKRNRGGGWLRGRPGRKVGSHELQDFRVCKWRLAVVALFVLGVQFALASNAPVVSGSYEVVQSTDLGSQTQIRMLIHLTNHGPYDLSIQRMTLWDFSHPDKGGSQAVRSRFARTRPQRPHRNSPSGGRTISCGKRECVPDSSCRRRGLVKPRTQQWSAWTGLLARRR